MSLQLKPLLCIASLQRVKMGRIFTIYYWQILVESIIGRYWWVFEADLKEVRMSNMGRTILSLLSQSNVTDAFSLQVSASQLMRINEQLLNVMPNPQFKRLIKNFFAAARWRYQSKIATKSLNLLYSKKCNMASHTLAK